MVKENDLRDRVVALEKRINQIAPANDVGTAHINWRALYKWLESEVEEVIFDPNASQFVKGWAERLKTECQRKLRVK